MCKGLVLQKLWSTGGGSSSHDNETSDCIEVPEFLDRLS
jgi:hypothetical protein